MNTTDLKVNTVYSLTLHPERITGRELNDVTFLARMDSTLVSAYGIIPDEEHKKVYASLPAGVPNSGSQYSWLVFRTLSGNLTVIGEPWVVANSVLGGDDVDVWDITDIKGSSVTPEHIRIGLSSMGIYEYNITKRT